MVGFAVATPRVWALAQRDRNAFVFEAESTWGGKKAGDKTRRLLRLCGQKVVSMGHTCML